MSDSVYIDVTVDRDWLHHRILDVGDSHHCELDTVLIKESIIFGGDWAGIVELRGRYSSGELFTQHLGKETPEDLTFCVNRDIYLNSYDVAIYSAITILPGVLDKDFLSALRAI